MHLKRSQRKINHFTSQGEKEKNLVDVHNFRLTLPTLQYQNRTWTWLDLMMVMKKDYKQVLVGQVSAFILSLDSSEVCGSF